MRDNVRLFFSVVWIVATCTTFALGILLVFTWNSHYLQYLYASLIMWGVATASVVLTSA